MSSASDLASGKGHTDENFPVASALIAARHRPAILAFYRFARSADDVADSPSASADEKLALLESMRASLIGNSDSSPESVALRSILAKRHLSNRHALDLLEAFRRDVTKQRYADWDELIDYCRYSAMPVGRFVLDVHGESESAWPANDALCAALQIVNHLQDCGKDWRELGRCYVPQDALAVAGATTGDLNAEKSTPALKSVIATLARRNAALLTQSKPFMRQVRDHRLGLEIGVIQSLAEDLNTRLQKRDPLSERVHHSKGEIAGVIFRKLGYFAASRLRPMSRPVETVKP